MAEPEDELPPEIKAGAPGVRGFMTRGDRRCCICRSWPDKGKRMWCVPWKGRMDAVCNTCANNLMVLGLVVLALVTPGGAS